MNIYIIAFILAWAAFALFGNKKLWKWGIISGSIGFVHEVGGIGMGLWSYDHNVAALLSNVLAVYPVTGILLLTYLPKGFAARVPYVITWTLFSVFMELVYVFPRHLSYIKWVTPYSIALYAGSYTMYIAAYHYLTLKGAKTVH